MGIVRWIVVAAMVTGCGSVSATTDAAGDDDAPPSCNGCISNGDACTADSECMSSECTCNSAACTNKVCAATACACGYTTSGATCDGDVVAGVTDKSCSAGCDGTGACVQPLLWFKFDEAVGAAVVNSGTWPGTVTRSGGTLGMTGKIGNAIGLAQSTDGVVIADPQDGSLDSFASWTVEAWVNFSTLPVGSNITIAKKDVGYLCRGVSSNNNQYFHQGIVFTPAQQPANFMMTTPATDTWYHAACTLGGGTLKLYWDGALVASATVTGTMSDSVAALGIGQSGADGENLTGMMDDFRMWSTTRTDRQICLDACGSFVAGACTFDDVCGN